MDSFIICDFTLTRGDVLAVLNQFAEHTEIPAGGFKDEHADRVLSVINVDSIEYAAMLFDDLESQTAIARDLLAEVMRDLGFIRGLSPYLH